MSLSPLIKGIVYPKLKICWKFPHSQVIQNVDEFVSSFCSEWVPSEWESKQLIKNHNNPQVIHMNPVHQLMSCEVKSCMFVRDNGIINMLSTSNSCFWKKKYESIIHNNTSPSPVVLSLWRHPFTAKDPLVSKWCYCTFLKICSHERGGMNYTFKAICCCAANNSMMMENKEK